MAPRDPLVTRRKNSGRSEMELAALIRERLGTNIEPQKLRQFICDKFVILSILCHEIHESNEAQK